MRLGQVDEAQADFEAALVVAENALEVSRRVRGEEHPETLDSMDYLAELYRKQRRYVKAEPLRARVLEVRRRVNGEEHLDTAHALNNLAALYTDQGKFAQAEPLLLRALAVCGHGKAGDYTGPLPVIMNLARNWILDRDAGAWRMRLICFNCVTQWPCSNRVVRSPISPG